MSTTWRMYFSCRDKVFEYWFLEDFRIMTSERDEPTVAISIRIPQNILRIIKLKAKAEGKKYQSLIIDYLRKGLRQSDV